MAKESISLEYVVVLDRFDVLLVSCYSATFYFLAKSQRKLMFFVKKRIKASLGEYDFL